ncbi:tryptophan synthase beta chain [Spirochaetota bacterium]|nr:tryptophan synthase beta chain [Spirochaetota bacterium]
MNLTNENHFMTQITATTKNPTQSPLQAEENTAREHYFGKYGGRYVPELLIPALDELEKAYTEAKQSPTFKKKLEQLLRDFGGRPTPLIYAENLSNHLGHAKIYLKNEGLLHTGAHKLNNAIGQALLTKQMGKTEVIAETGAGQHGLATAAICAKLNLRCKIFMGTLDIKRQYPNVYNMKLMGAEIIPVADGNCTLKDAVNAAMKYWIEHLATSHYLIGSALGPAPFPRIVRDFQAIIGTETRKTILEREKRLPSHVVACAGGGSNALGMFTAFLTDANVELIAVEAGGSDTTPGNHAARMLKPDIGIAQGYKSFFLQNPDGQLMDTHSISAGLDYPGIAPELAYFAEQGRIQFLRASDDDCLTGYKLLSLHEGIVPALETAHAISKLPHIVNHIKKNTQQEALIIVNLSGRGDKDLFIAAPHINPDDWTQFLKTHLPKT